MSNAHEVIKLVRSIQKEGTVDIFQNDFFTLDIEEMEHLYQVIRNEAIRGEQESKTKLSDESGFCIGSLPLPQDHWLYAPQVEGWDFKRDCSPDTPKPILGASHRDAVKAAVRWAIRGATARGTVLDFDPDALVLNALYALTKHPDEAENIDFKVAYNMLRDDLVEKDAEIDRLRLELTARSFAIDRVSLTLDGDKWCALYGSNLQEGVAGFGKTPLEAIKAFDKELCGFLKGLKDELCG